MRWGHSEIYPNQYVVLIGPSGVRKGEPLKIAKKFLTSIGSNLIAESITREALIRRMKGDKTTYHTGEVKMQSAVSLVSEEFSVFLADKAPSFLADLTDWYDSGEKWTYETKNQGTDEVLGLCVNILAAMAPDWIPVTLPQSAIGGGFTSRILFIVEHRKGKNISNPNTLGANDPLRKALEADLEMIQTLSGEMEFDRDAMEEYERWYLREEKRTAAGSPAISDPKFAGYVSRRATHLKKISMACSAARSNSLTISRMDLLRARTLMEQAEVQMAEVFGKFGRAANAEMTQTVLEYVKGKGRVRRSEVMQMFYRDIDSTTMEVIESTLIASRFMRKTGVDSMTGDSTYEWIG
jgi:hypothetical protein